MEWLVVVEISATLFQPARSGSHLIFRTPTPRAVEDFIVKDLSDSRGSYHLAGFCLASLICILIISQILRFVKTFFNFFLGAVGDLNPHFNILPTLGGYS